MSAYGRDIGHSDVQDRGHHLHNASHLVGHADHEMGSYQMQNAVVGTMLDAIEAFWGKI